MWNLDGSNAVKLENIRPSPDGDGAIVAKNIYFTVVHDSSAELFADDFKNQRLAEIGRLSQTLSLGTLSLALSPDGKWILYAVIDHTKSDIRLRRETPYNP